MKDLYQILGVSRQASKDDIKKSYRNLARTMHPDANKGDPKAEEKFKELTFAYDILSSPEKRAKYDNGLLDEHGNERPGFHGFKRGPGGGGGPYNRQGGFDFSDIFGGMDDIGDFFKQSRKTSRPGRGSFKQKGANITYSLKISFEDAAAGTTKQVGMTTGKSLKITIPPGTKDGTTLRLKEQGTPGIGGGMPGDALVNITVLPHAYFRQEGNDIHIDVPITLQEAVSGGSVTVPTLTGQVAVRVPPNSNSGTKLRLKGKGIAAKNAAGDQFVHLMIVLPEKPDKALTDFVKKWKPVKTDPRKKAGFPG